MVVKKFKFNYQGENKEINAEICDNILSKARGLMFRRKSKPLLFIFNSKKLRTIHSFFCKPFVAVWFNDSKIIDIKILRKWRLNIKPVEKFDKLLEIPSENKEFDIFSDG